MTKEVFNVLFDIFSLVVAGAVGGLIVLLFDHRLSISRELHFKRMPFIHYIESRRKVVENKGPNEFFHEIGQWRDIPKFETEVSAVEPFILRHHKTRFEIACKTFRRIGFNGNEQEDAQAKTELVKVLNELLKCAK